MVDPEELKHSFEEIFASEARIFSAPGRINLIGEHTDYNEGFVLPMAANLRTYVAAAPAQDGRIDVHSFDLHERVSVDIRNDPVASDNWVSYVHGLAKVLTEQGANFSGARLAIASDVPIGAGLSSSAALEVAVGYALLRLAKAEVDLKQLALASQEAEHRFVGTRSGLMDQLTAAFAEKDHALFIDCRSLELDPIRVNLGEAAIVVCDTKVRHKLATSGYNERRRECEMAVTLLRQKKPSIRALRDVTLADLARFGELLPEPVRRRSKHVVSENERTLQARDALKGGDINDLGNLMNSSHESLRDDYEVSSRELEVMVDLARKHSGTLGARMMGGGFGGSTVNLVRKSTFESFETEVSEGYQSATGQRPTIMMIEPDGGVEEHAAVTASTQ